MLKTVNETLKQIDSLPTEDERIIALRKYPALTQIFKIVFEEGVTMLLPDTDPPYKTLEFFDQENRLWAELRRLRIFLNITPEYANLKPIKREQLFIELLESIPQDDAKLILQVKNKKLPFKNITAKTVMVAYPGLIQVPVVTNLPVTTKVQIVSPSEGAEIKTTAQSKAPAVKKAKKEQPEKTGLTQWQKYKMRKAEKEAAAAKK